MNRLLLLFAFLMIECVEKAQLSSRFVHSSPTAAETYIPEHKTPYNIVPFIKNTLETDDRFMNWEDNKACVKWVNEQYDSLSLDEKIGQCFMLAAYTSADKMNMPYVQRMVNERKCGGILFFKGAPTAQAYWTNRLQDSTRIPLMVAIDGEWGIAMRVDSTVAFPHELTLGAIQDNGLIRKMGIQIGKDCKRIGVNVNFAPVVDVNNNPNNPVINDRSFGEDKMNVAIKGVEYADGLQSTGVLACAKHFPGHGDTDKDSHYGLPTINKSLEQFDTLELFPFKLLFSCGVGSVMSAHLSLPQLDTSRLPGSISQKVTTGLLKEHLGFKGLVFTDALNMKGAANSFAPGTLDSMAFVAGNDVLEFSENAEMGISKIKKGITDGVISMHTLEEKVKKILAYKYILGLHERQSIDLTDLVDSLNSPAEKVLRQELYNNATTIAATEKGMLPLQNSYKKMATLAIDNKGVSDFQNHLEQFLVGDKYFFSEENDVQYQAKAEEIANHDLVIIGVHGMSRLASKNYGLSDATLNFIHQLGEKTNIIIVLFGSPYALKYFENEKNVLVAYEDNDATQLAAANALLGGIRSTGKLPVTACARFKAGVGVNSDTIIRMKIATPEDVGSRTIDFNEINEVVLNGLIAHAYPGCQVAVVKNNQLIWNRTYGNKFNEGAKVATTDLYDLASITKVTATTLAVMKLYDEQKIDLSAAVGEYLTLDDSATIKGLVISDILTHQAGLKPFFEFFRSTIDTNFSKYYRSAPEDKFSTPVAENLYIRNDYADSMWRKMYTSEVKPDQGYVYSDIDFYILQKVVEHITQQPLDRYVTEHFYKPMGLMRTGYTPLNWYEKRQIAPTEDDKIFRKQTVRGYVHDPGAAMYGGVAGHAGLFSNAVDLAQIMQMLLNGGTYNGKRFLSANTITLFTKQHSAISRRGLGFDKPESDPNKKPNMWEGAHLSVFGHTGFTGTCVWSDPVSQLTFVFLSNRVYPDAENPKLVRMNIRGDLQRIINRAVKPKQTK
jgi:beta-N-acetylhexosaminidase